MVSLHTALMLAVYKVGLLRQVVSEEDAKAFAMFMSCDDVAKTDIAESLREKLTAKQTELGSRLSGNVDAAVVRLWTLFWCCAELFTRYFVH